MRTFFSLKSVLPLLLIAAAALFLSCKKEDPIPPKDDPITQDTLKGLKFLALGDSYTIGESVTVADRWPNQLDRRLEAEAVFVDSVKIIARTGWRTDQLLAEISNQALSSDWDMVAVLIGVNNQYQGRPIGVYENEFEDCLQAAIALAGGDKNKVFVVSIPDYAYTPFGGGSQSISDEIDDFNAVNLANTNQYEVDYYNITPISREGLDKPNYVANDGLHPSGDQYAAWVESFYREVAAQLRR